MSRLRDVLIACGCALTALAVPAQDDATAKKEPDPAILEKIDTLEDAIKDRKGERDSEAIGLIDELLAQYDALHEKSQTEFVKALSRVYKVKRKPEEASLYTATAAALGKIGGKSASKILVAAFDDKKFKKRDEWASLQDMLLENVGRTKDDKQTKFLLDLAGKSPHDGVMAAAGHALRHYEEAEYKVRHEIVKELQKHYARVYNGANQNLNPGDPVVDRFKGTLRAVADKWNETLSKLTGESFRTSPEWTSWWNDYKNKPKDWKNQSEG